MGSLALSSSIAWCRADCSQTRSYKTPLDDLGPGQYQGSVGGLYPSGSNTRPASHERALDRTGRMVLLDASGSADAANGIFVLISIGFSNASVEFSTFMDDVAADPNVNARVVPVNCAQEGATSEVISDPQAMYWADVDHCLLLGGVTAQQVQSVWLKDARFFPTEVWPESATVVEDDRYLWHHTKPGPRLRPTRPHGTPSRLLWWRNLGEFLESLIAAARDWRAECFLIGKHAYWCACFL
jgi:hypothetical protein